MDDMKKIMPFIPVNFGSFVCLVVVFCVMGAAILAYQTNEGWWQGILNLTRLIRSPRKVEDLENEAGSNSGEGS